MGRVPRRVQGPGVPQRVESHASRIHLSVHEEAHRLSIYESADSKENIRRALIEKLESLVETTHYTSLSADDLRKALHGGFRRIVAALGMQKASLDIRQGPQIITITGSTRDLETAQTLLDQYVPSNFGDLALGESTNEQDCAVCWTEAEDAYRTPCGHVYCASCFTSQCCSAGEGDLSASIRTPRGSKTRYLPPRSNSCSKTSFATHVRTHTPRASNTASTPDCQQIYRVSAAAAAAATVTVVVTCPSCPDRHLAPPARFHRPRTAWDCDTPNERVGTQRRRRVFRTWKPRTTANKGQGFAPPFVKVPI